MRKLAIAVITGTAVLLGSAGVLGHDPRVLPMKGADIEVLVLPGGWADRDVLNLSNKARSDSGLTEFVIDALNKRKSWAEIRWELPGLYEQELAERDHEGDMEYPIALPMEEALAKGLWSAINSVNKSPEVGLAVVPEVGLAVVPAVVPVVSSLLKFLGMAIAAGMTWDVIKVVAERFYEVDFEKMLSEDGR